MPLQSSNPVVVDEKSYPFFGLQLAISPSWSDNPALIGARVSAQFIPFRVSDEGVVERLDDQPKPFVAVDMFALAAESPALAEAVGKIMEGFQTIITERGL